MTKKQRARGWMITLPAKDYDADLIQRELKPHTFVGQLEVGDETGYLHWQLWVESKNPIQFQTLRNKFPKGHFEPRFGTPLQCFNYVTKLETRYGGNDASPITNEELGMPELSDHRKNQGKRSDLEEYIEMVDSGLTAREIVREKPMASRYEKYIERYEEACTYVDRNVRKCETSFRQFTVHYVWGPTRVGKTKSIMYELHDVRDVYRASGYKYPFDAYNYQPVVILDEFNDQMDFQYVLNLLDGHPLQLQCRYKDKTGSSDFGGV